MEIIVLLSLLTGIGRCFIRGHALSWAGTYEAFAHIWVGALLVFCFQKGKLRGPAIFCLAAITLIELIAFAAFARR